MVLHQIYETRLGTDKVFHGQAGLGGRFICFDRQNTGENQPVQL
jgi:hypothetical protein